MRYLAPSAYTGYGVKHDAVAPMVEAGAEESAGTMIEMMRFAAQSGALTRTEARALLQRMITRYGKEE